MKYDFRNQVVVIAGASSGLGACCAIEYAKSGAKVALLARRKEALERIKEEIENRSGQAEVFICDVQSETSVEQAVKSVKELWGRIDVLLNTAGIAVGRSVEKLKEDDWNRCMDINVGGSYRLDKFVVPIMKEQSYGRIIHISSIASVVGEKNPPIIQHAYNAAKAGVNGLTIGMACSVAQYGITVNAVAPGLFPSPLTEPLLNKLPDYVDTYEAKNPVGRKAKIEEVAEPILFLSSREASYITGQILYVDGGQHLV